MFEKLTERYMKIFERPAPIAVCDKSSIEASSAPGFLDGYFIVKNAGGGSLEGDVSANSSHITFSNNLIEGYDVIVEYEIDLTHLHPGDIFKSRIMLTTSGGQLVIPVRIFIEQHGIKCGRFFVQTLKDFEGCAQAIPEDAADLFATSEFGEWLKKTGCEHMEYYRALTEGTVGIKEMDCFLTACGLKETAALSPKHENVNVTVPYGVEELTETITLSAISWGFIEYSVKTAGNSPWLVLRENKITNASMIRGEQKFEFRIIPSQMRGVKQFETIVFESGNDRFSVNVTAQKPKPFTVGLSRRSYRSEDSGYLIVENYTGSNAMLEIAALESFVRFKAGKYLVSERAEIPFEIKVNSFLNLGIGRKPVNISEVVCRTVIEGKIYKETLTVRAGSLVVG